MLLIICGYAIAVPFESTMAEGTDYSDLARVSRNSYLTVNDRKNPIHPGYRVGLLTVTADQGLTFQPVIVEDWKDLEGEPSDLEACCSVPDRENEFLLAESSIYDGKYGRIFHATLTWQGDQPALVVNGVMRIYDRQLDQRQRTYSSDNVAGIACLRVFDRLVLVVGERGGDSARGTRYGTLYWGDLDLENYRFRKLGESPLVNRSVLGSRDCSALHLVKRPDQRIAVISVATNDPDDNGPFYSVIYHAGDFYLNQQSASLSFRPEPRPNILATLTGVKVEGLAEPAAHVPGSDFAIATDDENLGGVWRPVRTQGWFREILVQKPR
jgi:hypothetical protein